VEVMDVPGENGL